MEFFIKKNATLPVLKIDAIKDGRSDYNRTMRFLESTDIFFSMVDTETNVPRISTRPAGFMQKGETNTSADTQYYVYYQFTPFDTKKVGRYKGQFLFRNETGILVMPLSEDIFINVTDSFIIDDFQFRSCYVVDYPCCFAPLPPTPPPYTTTTTTNNITSTTTTTIPVTTTSTTTGPEPSGYTEWVISYGFGNSSLACDQSAPYVTAYTPVMSALTIGQTLWATPNFDTYPFGTNGSWFKILTRNGLPYLPNTIIYVGQYSLMFGNYTQVIYTHECGTSFPCKCYTYTKTENNVYNSLYVNCNGISQSIILPFGGSQTFCAAFTQPYTYINQTGGINNCIGGVCP